jgi:hypothetical protein
MICEPQNILLRRSLVHDHLRSPQEFNKLSSLLSNLLV